MDVSLKKLPNSEIELTIEIPGEELEDVFKKTTREMGKDLAVKGFRKGEAPLEILEKELGPEKILIESAETAIREKYLEAVKQEKVVPLGQPQIEVLKMARHNPFVFKAKVSVLTDILLPDCQKIAAGVKKKKVVVDAKEGEEALLWLQKSRASFSQLDRPARKGDFIEIEFTSSVEQGKVKDSFILGEGRLIPGFEEKLEGMKAAEEKDFSLKFPKEYARKDLAGKAADFKIKMLSVQKMELPEMNDEWARSLGDFKDVDGLKQNIRDGIRKEREEAEKQRVRQEILDKIVEQSGLKPPPALVNAEQERLLANLKKKVVEELKITFEDYLKQIKKSEKEALGSLEFEAQKRVKNFLILDAIAEKEKIEVSAEEIGEEVDKILQSYSSPEKAAKNLDLVRLREYTEDVIRNEKTLAKLESYSS